MRVTKGMEGMGLNENKTPWLLLWFFLVLMLLTAFSLGSVISHAEETSEDEFVIIGESTENEWYEPSDDDVEVEEEEIDIPEEYPDFDEVEEYPEFEDITVGSSEDDENKDFPPEPVIGESETNVVGMSQDFTIGQSSMIPYMDDLKALRLNSDILIYCVIPFAISFLLLYKLCVWFYDTFIDSAL